LTIVGSYFAIFFPLIRVITGFRREFRAEMTVMKTDILQVRTDVTVMKSDISELKTDVSENKFRLTAVES